MFEVFAGDFGLPWTGDDAEEKDIQWLESRPYTVLFVDGNHERYDYLKGRPTEKWNGGLVQRLRPHSPILRLMREKSMGSMVQRSSRWAAQHRLTRCGGILAKIGGHANSQANGTLKKLAQNSTALIGMSIT